MQAIWRGQVIADSDRTLEIKGYRYFPREAVRMDLLTPAPRTSADHACPHGVQFFDISDGTSHSDRAAWSYEAPQPDLRPIDHWIGFWEDVKLA
jgi:uncharacterized protein (DUF427 family)